MAREREAEGARTKAGGRKEERQTRRRGQRVLSIRAHSQNPQIISAHWLEFEPRRKCEMTFLEEKKRGVMGLDVNLLLDSCGCQSRRDV